jgi:hypothetical protein
VTDQVGSFAAASAGLFSVSETGVLTYRGSGPAAIVQLTWFDRQGKPLGTIGDKAAYQNPAISPDGSRVAVAQFDRQNGNSNVWVMDLARGTSTKVTFSPGRNDFPVWSPDGKTPRGSNPWRPFLLTRDGLRMRRTNRARGKSTFGRFRRRKNRMPLQGGSG